MVTIAASAIEKERAGNALNGDIAIVGTRWNGEDEGGRPVYFLAKAGGVTSGHAEETEGGLTEFVNGEGRGGIHAGAGGLGEDSAIPLGSGETFGGVGGDITVPSNEGNGAVGVEGDGLTINFFGKLDVCAAHFVEDALPQGEVNREGGGGGRLDGKLGIALEGLGKEDIKACKFGGFGGIGSGDGVARFFHGEVVGDNLIYIAKVAFHVLGQISGVEFDNLNLLDTEKTEEIYGGSANGWNREDDGEKGDDEGGRQGWAHFGGEKFFEHIVFLLKFLLEMGVSTGGGDGIR